MICAIRRSLFSTIFTALSTLNMYALQTSDQPTIRTYDLGGGHAYDSATFYKEKQFLAYGCFSPDQPKPSFKHYTITDGACVGTPLDNAYVSQLHLSLLNNAYPLHHHDSSTISSCYTQAYQICVDTKSIQAFPLQRSQEPIIHELYPPLEPGSSIAATDLLDKPIVAISYPSENAVRYFDILNKKQTKDILLPDKKIVQVSLPPSSGGREKVPVALVLADTAHNTFTCAMHSLGCKRVNDALSLCVYKRTFTRSVSPDHGENASMLAQWNSSCRYVTWLLRTQSTAHTQDTHLPLTLYQYKLIAHDPEQFTQEHHAYAHASFTIASSRELPPAGAQPDSRLENIIIGSTLVKNLQFSWKHIREKKRSPAPTAAATAHEVPFIFHSYPKILACPQKKARTSKKNQAQLTPYPSQVSQWKTFELPKPTPIANTQPAPTGDQQNVMRIANLISKE